MTTEVRSRATNDHTKARESATQKTTQIFGTPVHLVIGSNSYEFNASK